MIDWNASNTTKEIVRTYHDVVVVCERCRKPRQIIYSAAKQTIEHICMSCRKKKTEHITGEMVLYKCVVCSIEKTQRYSIPRFKDWHCHHCVMARGHKNGKFKICRVKMTEETKNKIGQKAKEQWANPEFRKKFSEQRATTRSRRSEISKKIWSDNDRLKKLSKSIKGVWQQSDYRELKTEQSQQLWEDEEYIKAHAIGMADPAVRQIISDASKKHWSIAHEAMVAIIKQNLSRPDVLKKLSNATTFNWTKIDYRKSVTDGIIKSLSDPELRNKISKISTALWENQNYRDATIAAIRAALAQPAVREKMAVARANQPRISSIQEQLYRYLDDLGAAYYREGDQTVIGFYTFDCLVQQIDGRKQLLIECQGDYWHSLAKAQQNDRAKFTYIDRYFPGYEIMYVWEHEFATEGRVLDRLKSKLGYSLDPVDFRFDAVQLRTPPSKDLQTFLNSYHYIGKDRGGVAIGAYLGDNLIGCIVFSPPLRQNTAGQFGLVSGDVCELSRLCIHPAYHKKNFASWLIAKALKKVTAKLVIAYADKTVGHAGTVYKASNFKEHHRVPADYWYVDTDGFVMHKRTLYGKAIKMSMTEASYAAEFGYVKQYGGDKICFVRAISP